MFSISDLLEAEMIKNGNEKRDDKQEIQAQTTTITRKITAHFLAGRGSSAYSRDGGKIIHAVPEEVIYASALCGISHGRCSAGWFPTESEINCPKCLKKLNKLNV